MASDPQARRPRLLVLNQYYWPGLEATAHLLTELCESLAGEYDVHVITGAQRSDEGAPGDVVRNGVRVERVRSTTYERARLSLRALNYLTFLAGALRQGLAAPRADVVLCMTDPPMIGAVAVAVARRHRAPLVVVSEDVFPEIATALGRLRNPLVVAALRGIVGFYLRRADRIVAIGETMRRRLVEKGAPSDRIRVIPNWVDASRIVPLPRDNDWARENRLDGRFVVMHSGNVGHAQDLDSLVLAAERLRDLEDLVVVIVGLGARRAEIVKLSKQLRLRNVRFLPYQPRERLSESLSTASVHVVGLAPGLAGYVVPSRLYGILSAGRPVIAAVEAESETAHLVAAADCGIHVPPGAPDQLAAAIRACHDGDVDLERLGANGRGYVEREGDRSIAFARYRELLEEVRAEAPANGAIRVVRVIARLNVGGPALHVSYLTRGLASRGYATTLVTGRVGRSEGSMEYVAEEAHVQPLYVDALQRNVSLFDDVLALGGLVRLIWRVRPHVVHTHTAKAGALGRAAAVLAISARPPVVVHTFHGHVLTGYFSRAASRVFLVLERLLAKASSTLIAVSPEVRDDLVRLGVAPASKFTVVRLGLDLERRTEAPEGARELVREELRVGEEQLLVAWLGRMTEIKRVDDLLRVHADLRGRGVDAVLALVGDGPDRPGLERLAAQLGIADTVRFTGFRGDVGSIYRAADVVALTSANEGTPVSLIEALAAGCAVVTTDVGGVADVVDSGRAGILVPAGDLAAFAGALEELAHDPDRRRALGEAGAHHVGTRYSVERLVSDVDELYRSLLAARKRP